MRTAMRRDKPFWRSRWWMPAFSLAMGAAILTAFAFAGLVVGVALFRWRG